MDMKFLIDPELILELILNRPYFSNNSRLVRDADTFWDFLEGDITSYVTETGLDKIISISKSLFSNEEENEVDLFTELISSRFKICYVHPENLHNARKINLECFELAIELVCAKALDVTAFVTHRPDKFKCIESNSVKVWSIEKFLDVLTLEKQVSVNSGNDKLCRYLELITRDSCFFKYSLNQNKRSNFSSPLKTPQFFIDHRHDFDKIKNLLSLSSGVSICGEAGTGKTGLALLAALAYKEEESFEAFIFVPAIYNIDISDGPCSPRKTSTNYYLRYFARIVATTFADDSINRSSFNEQIEQILLRLRKKKTLIILDGLDCLGGQSSEIQFLLKNLPSNNKVILTSRAEDFEFPRLDLSTLSHNSSIQKLQYICKNENLILKEAEINQISEFCMGNLLAINAGILQYENYPGSIDWKNIQHSSTNELLQFLARKLIESLKSKYAELLLMSLAFAKNSFDLEVLTHMIGVGVHNESKSRQSLAELCRLSLVVEDGRRYSLNPTIQELIRLAVQQLPGIAIKLHDRLLNSYIELTDMYGGTDWGDWHVNYDFLDAEWENLQSILQFCFVSNSYQSFKHLWQNLNHFADLYGYWSDRDAWLEAFMHLSKINDDQDGYVYALSRKAWTLIMINQPNTLKQAELLLNEAWNLRDKTSPENQNYLSHHRVVFYIRCERYKEAQQALIDQENTLKVLNDVLIDERTLKRHELNFQRNQAKLEYELGEFVLARQRFEKVLREAQSINWLRGVCYVQNKLADIALRLKDLHSAKVYLETGLPIARQNRNKRRIAGYEESFAMLEKLRGDTVASQLWAKSAAHRYEFIGMISQSKKLTHEYGLSKS